MQSKNEKVKLYICIAGLLFLFAIETIGKITTNEYIHTIWILTFSVALSYEGVLYLLSFLIPVCTLLPHFAHVFLVIFLVLLFKKYFAEHCKTVNLSWAFIPAFALWELLAYINYSVASINKVIGYISVICVFFWALYEKKHGDYKKHLNLYIFGVFVLSILVFITTIRSYSGNWISAFLNGGLRLGGTASSNFDETDVSLNANTLAYFSIVAIACYLSLNTGKQTARSSAKTFQIIELSVIVIMGMLTVSRSWLLILVVVIGGFILSKFGNEKNLNKTIPILIVLFILTILFLNSGFMKAFALRFQGESVNTAGGRTELIKQYFALFFANAKYMILGTGVTDYTIVMGTSTSMHNAIQQILICLGLPLAAVFFVAIVIPFLKAQRKQRAKLQMWLPFIAVVLFVQTIQFLNPGTFMLPYLMGLYAILQNRNNDNYTQSKQL